MPPKPIRMLGRDSEATVATSVLSSTSPRLLILGDGGMGKSTLALWAMYNENVQKRYESRMFVSCEGVNSLSLLINKVADVLRVPSTSRNAQLYDIVLRALREQPRLLCLDNFEAPWEDTSSRVEVEEFLRHLHAIPDLALIVTMRGTERPAIGLPWSPALSPLSPLTLHDAIEMFEDILCKPADADAILLIEAVACIPLAVMLVAALAQDQSSAQLLQGWKIRGTEIVETSGADRGSNLGVSISISVHSRRMQENPLAKDVLALAALLPDGVSTTILDQLVAHAKGLNIYKALSTLQHLALIRKVDVDDVTCYQMLPPVRRWCIANLLAPQPLKEALYQTYATFLSEHSNRKITNNHLVVKPELVNAEEVLLLAFRDNFKHPDLCVATLTHNHWSMYAGYVSDTVIREAIAHSEGSSKGHCLQQLAHVQSRRNEYSQMEHTLKSALEMHEQARDVQGKADDLQCLGQVYRALHRLDEAKGALKHALELHRRTQDDSGQAGDLFQLGHMLVYHGTFEEAEEALRLASELHERAGHDIGKASDLFGLGTLYTTFGRLDEAEGPLTVALEIHKHAQDGLGEAKVLRALGWLYMRLDRLDDAEQALELALERYQQFRSVPNEAHGARCLGDLYTRRGKLDEAGKALKRALELSHAGTDKAITLRLSGVLYTRCDWLDKAEMDLESALEISRQLKSVPGEADVLWNFGELEIRRGALGSAERYLQSALEKHRQVDDKESIGIDHRVLGQIYTAKGEYDKADEAIRTALEIHRSTRDHYWERMALQALAELQDSRAEVKAGQQNSRCSGD